VQAANQHGVVPGLLRRARVLFLLCCVVLAQQGTVLHALSHLKLSGSTQTEVSQQPSLPSDQLCAQCLAYQGVGSALAGSGAAAAIIDPVASSLFAPAEEFFPVTGAPFSSRAPPPLLS
jgi:hypothetical protein